MKTIIVDDEPMMLKRFQRLSSDIEEINIVGAFMSPLQALVYAKIHPVELAVLDIEMPQMSGIELAQKLKALYPKMLIVFISAFDDYIGQSNEIGADYYMVKPYKQEVLVQMAQKMALLARRLQKPIYIRTFGRFTVLRNGEPLPLVGKAKEILALVVTKRGKEISNEEIYSTIWENRAYGNVEMKVYYNALKRLRDALQALGLSELLISTTRGQMINTELFDCDYYAYLDKNLSGDERFEGEFLSEYSWGEYILANMTGDDLL